MYTKPTFGDQKRTRPFDAKRKLHLFKSTFCGGSLATGMYEDAKILKLARRLGVGAGNGRRDIFAFGSIRITVDICDVDGIKLTTGKDCITAMSDGYGSGTKTRLSSLKMTAVENFSNIRACAVFVHAAAERNARVGFNLERMFVFVENASVECQRSA